MIFDSNYSFLSFLNSIRFDSIRFNDRSFGLFDKTISLSFVIPLPTSAVSPTSAVQRKWNAISGLTFDLWFLTFDLSSLFTDFQPKFRRFPIVLNSSKFIIWPLFDLHLTFTCPLLALYCHSMPNRRCDACQLFQTRQAIKFVINAIKERTKVILKAEEETKILII